MSTAFTSVVDGLDWQANSFINELTVATRERLHGQADTNVPVVSAGHDIQAAVFWYYMQFYLDATVNQDIAAYPDYFNNSSSFAGLTIAQINARAWTTWGSTFFTHAGLRTDGWRAAIAWDPATDTWTDVTDGMYIAARGSSPWYNEHIPGDIIGPWLFVDIQNVCSKLTWTSATGAIINGANYIASGGIYTGSQCAVDFYYEDRNAGNVYVLLETQANAQTSTRTSTLTVPQPGPNPNINAFMTLKWDYTNSN